MNLFFLDCIFNIDTINSYPIFLIIIIHIIVNITAFLLYCLCQTRSIPTLSFSPYEYCFNLDFGILLSKHYFQFDSFNAIASMFLICCLSFFHATLFVMAYSRSPGPDSMSVSPPLFVFSFSLSLTVYKEHSIQEMPF